MAVACVQDVEKLVVKEYAGYPGGRRQVAGGTGGLGADLVLGVLRAVASCSVASDVGKKILDEFRPIDGVGLPRVYCHLTLKFARVSMREAQARAVMPMGLARRAVVHYKRKTAADYADVVVVDCVTASGFLAVSPVHFQSSDGTGGSGGGAGRATIAVA